MGIRVFQLASETGLSTAEVVSLCGQLSIAVKNHVSMLSDEESSRVRARINRRIVESAIDQESDPKPMPSISDVERGRTSNQAAHDLSSEAEEAARRHALRIGFRVADCREVALPVYKLNVVAVIVEWNPLLPIPKFVLKAIDAGLGCVEEISGLLGLDQALVRDALVELMRSTDVHLTAPPNSRHQAYMLSPKGRRTLQQAQLAAPQQRSLSIHFDGLLRRVIGVGRSSLLSPRQVRFSGAIEIPPFPAKRPQLEDLKLAEVETLVSQAGAEGEGKYRRKGKLLALKSLERRERFFQKAFAVVYKSIDGDEVQVAFEIDGRLSREHENAFAGADSACRRGIVQAINATRVEQVLAEVLPQDVIEEASPSEELEAVKEQAGCAAAELGIAQEKLKTADTAEQKKAAEQAAHHAERRLAEWEAELAKHTTRHLGVFEHRPLLEKALQDSKERLFIVSPWMTPEVVDANFRSQVEELLKRRVHVYIGYGIGEEKDEKAGQKQVVVALRTLANKYDRFIFKRLKVPTHAKILVSDHVFGVVTSFNWLSFQGSPDRTFRDERGVFFCKGALIDSIFNEYLPKFGD
jgi:hypothetical protein